MPNGGCLLPYRRLRGGAAEQGKGDVQNQQFLNCFDRDSLPRALVQPRTDGGSARLTLGRQRIGRVPHIASQRINSPLPERTSTVSTK